MALGEMLRQEHAEDTSVAAKLANVAGKACRRDRDRHGGASCR